MVHTEDTHLTTSSTTTSTVYATLLKTCSAPHTDTRWHFLSTLRQTYPNTHIIATDTYQTKLLDYASAGQAVATPLTNTLGGHHPFNHEIRKVSAGEAVSLVQFGGYHYVWENKTYTIYISEKAPPPTHYEDVPSDTYIIAESAAQADELLLASAAWASQSHGEVWMFDRSEWNKSKDLWNSIQNSRWEDVILDAKVKHAVRKDVEGFFASEEIYRSLSVPWKRGIILHGPPGNGKTICVKALMATLQPKGVQTLYVKSLASCSGPEYCIRSVFVKARGAAPCLLIFEDLDSFITDKVRSYFLNEIDGLESNDGILMIGSTNHLDKLDPSISKRPSRFDRKYFYALPDEGGRASYCKYWQHKLRERDELGFTDDVVKKIAEVTEGFSFAYMKELFVASLLAITNKDDDGELTNGHVPEETELAKSLLWKVAERQVEILQDEMKAANEAENDIERKREEKAKESVEMESDSE